MSDYQKPSVLAKSHNSLASLVSFRPFVDSGILTLKVCRALCTIGVSNSETGVASMTVSPLYIGLFRS